MCRELKSCRGGRYLYVVLVYDTVWSGKWVEMFRTDIVPPYSEQNAVYCLSYRTSNFTPKWKTGRSLPFTGRKFFD